MEREILGVEELAEFLGVNRKTVLEYAKAGLLPHRALGRRLLFSRALVTEWRSQGKLEEAHRAFAGPARPLSDYHLYAIVGMHTRRVKIGRATNVASRLRDLQAGSPDDLVVIGWASNLGEYESWIHRALRAERVRGEWFSPTIAADIVRTCEIGGCDEPSEDFAFWATYWYEASEAGDVWAPGKIVV